MNPKIRNYSALALATVAVMPLGCKKDDPGISDPNIEDKTWNKVITAVLINPNEYVGEDSIDINSDGAFDFNIGIGKGTNSGDAYNYFAFYDNSAGNQVLTESLGGYFCLKSLASGTAISSASTSWFQYGYGAYFTEYYSLDVGNIKPGTGDKLVGFRFKIGSATHYGWAKFNYAADKLSVTLVETGYNKTADASINAGAK